MAEQSLKSSIGKSFKNDKAGCATKSCRKKKESLEVKILDCKTIQEYNVYAEKKEVLLQSVNLPQEEKWLNLLPVKHDSEGKPLDKKMDRLGRVVRVKVISESPNVQFKITMIGKKKNVTYSDAEKGRESYCYGFSEDGKSFVDRKDITKENKYLTIEKLFETDGKGEKILYFRLTAAGGNQYHFVAESFDGKIKSNDSATIETHRAIFYQEFMMRNKDGTFPPVQDIKQFLTTFAECNIKLCEFSKMNYIDYSTDTDKIYNSARVIYKPLLDTFKTTYTSIDNKVLMIPIIYVDTILKIKYFSIENIKIGEQISPDTHELYDNTIDIKSISFRTMSITYYDKKQYTVIDIDEINPYPSYYSISKPQDKVVIAINIKELFKYFNNSIIGKSYSIDNNTEYPKIKEGAVVSIVLQLYVGEEIGGIASYEVARVDRTTNYNTTRILIHEFAHTIGMVPSGVEDEQRNRSLLHHDHHDSKHPGHCNSYRVYYNLENKRIEEPDCIMYFSSSANYNPFCISCLEAVRKVDLSNGWEPF